MIKTICTNKKNTIDDKIWNCIKEFIKSYLSKYDSVVDLGCGNGKNIKYLLENGFVDVGGCDIDNILVNDCAQNNISIIKANILSLPYKKDNFDCVLCNGVIHHIETDENRKKAIKEIFRICRPGGKIFISVNSFESKHYSKITNVQDIVIRYKNKDVFLHLYTEQELTDIFLSLDCKILKITHECSCLRIVTEKN